MDKSKAIIMRPVESTKSSFENILNMFTLMCGPEINEMSSERAERELSRLLKMEPLSLFTSRHAPIFVALYRRFFHDPYKKALLEIDPEASIKLLIEEYRFKQLVLKLNNAKSFMINF